MNEKMYLVMWRTEDDVHCLTMATSYLLRALNQGDFRGHTFTGIWRNPEDWPARTVAITELIPVMPSEKMRVTEWSL